MKPISFSNLVRWIFEEYSKSGSIFEISKDFFYYKKNNLYYNFLNQELDLPIGPAAGPHTQLAQNIISSYLTGGRYIELKTVQLLDRLTIDRPCIDAEDECYNVEWSQELTLPESYSEYLKSYLLINFLNAIFKFSFRKNSGFILNMSVGYNLEGIMAKSVDDFIEKMKNAKLTDEFETYKSILVNFVKTDIDKYISVLPEIQKNAIIKKIVEISPSICNSVTISTMHGCPGNEISSIAEYLISEKKLNTILKLNPTLSGFERVREILDKNGYNYISIDKSDFEHDLQYSDAIKIITFLKKFADSNEKIFGIKLSNTLCVDNKKYTLKGPKMYLSGRPLFLITFELANKISKDLQKSVPISYSGGAEAKNINSIIEKGFLPVTLATDLLKPPGYVKLNHIAQQIEDKNFIPANDKDITFSKANYKTTRKIIGKTLPLIDCFIEPCKYACPINQSIPEYIELARLGKYSDAFEIITATNPLPHITGYICDHQCMFNCTRIEYDKPVDIREIKKIVTLEGFSDFISKLKTQPQPQLNLKIAVIGAGPSGLSAAYFLAKKGYDVTIFEKENKAGGTVRYTIPQFRIPQDVIDKDIELISKSGVKFIFNYKENFDLEELTRDGFKYIYLAIGALKPKEVKLNFDNQGVLDALKFLRDFNNEKIFEIGKKITVIGGGNCAMDAARAAKRLKGVETVSIIYRRTKEQMPADLEEYDAAINDGIAFYELLSPISFESNELRCQRQKLVSSTDNKRMEITPIENEYVSFQIDTVILAIGEMLDDEFLKKNKIELKSGLFTSKENVYIGGDARRGPSTVVESIADGKQFAQIIFEKENDISIPIDSCEQQLFDISFSDKINKRKKELDLSVNKKQETELGKIFDRCLVCSYECNRCVEVCPNRANLKIDVSNHSEFINNNQIIHLYDSCNECGNCETFCPYNGAPYKDKLTYFSDISDFGLSNNSGFCIIQKNDEFYIKIRMEQKEFEIKRLDELKIIDSKEIKIIKTFLDRIIDKKSELNNEKIGIF